MLTMQKCVAGDVLVSEKGDARRRLASVSEIHCVSCQRLVTQGRYYCELSRLCPTMSDSTNTHFQTALNVAVTTKISTFAWIVTARARHVTRQKRIDYTST